jgi:hypothetical protein
LRAHAGRNLARHRSTSGIAIILFNGGNPIYQLAKRFLVGGNTRGLRRAFRLSAASHPATFRCTTTASFSASLAMIHRVLATFLRAGIAYIGAGNAGFVCKLAVTRHVTCRKTAHLCTVHIEPYTAGHRLDILLG